MPIYMATQLKSHGWQYIVVEIPWSEPNPKSHGHRLDTELNAANLPIFGTNLKDM